MIGVREEEATEGVAFAFLTFFLSCFFGRSSLQILRLFLRHLLPLFLYDSSLFPGVVLDEEVETGVSRDRTFMGHMTRFPAPEAMLLLPQLITNLRGEFGEVLGTDSGGFLLIDIMGRPAIRIA